ncbi:hypothetical protein MA04_02743 [Alcanivorax balearicus MACL04]|uniref:Uncharacterized protein n=1 Tax=Alloalcanivorax balearicus MACL04 TaxID=1177182 RepID=A0ABT2R108_9GAMM|nr:hypothetical protein [Alloalcanivorax balearicus MACL04]
MRNHSPIAPCFFPKPITSQFKRMLTVNDKTLSPLQNRQIRRITPDYILACVRIKALPQSLVPMTMIESQGVRIGLQAIYLTICLSSR